MARLSFEIGTLFDGKALVEDVAFHMGLRLERNAQAPDGSNNVAAHDYILSCNATRHLTLVAKQKRAATNVALDLAVDLDLAFRGDHAFYHQVLADNRRGHLARTWAGALRIANAHTQLGDFIARLGLRRDHY